jgi:tetratricopeptide (TPR) repeat protein
MDSNGCLNSAELVRFREGQYSEGDKATIEKHLQECRRCSHNIQLLEGVSSLLAGGKQKMGQSNEHERTTLCLTPEMTYRYLERDIDEEERVRVENHLDECFSCYEAMVSLLKNSLTPATELEKNAIHQLTRVTPERQVSQLLSYVETDSKIQRDEVLVKGFWERLKLFFRFPETVAIGWRSPALASLALLLLSIGIYQGLRFYNRSWPLTEAEQLLQQNYRVYMKDTARLSGGYHSTGVGALMSGEEADRKPETSFSGQALALAQKAATKGANPDKIRQIEAQVYIIQNEYAKADSLYQQIEGPESRSAPLLNDQGVLRFAQQDWEKAQEYFEASLKVDPNLREAWYNLALVKAQRGDLRGASSALGRYLKLETDEGWRNAGLEFQKRLQSR